MRYHGGLTMRIRMISPAPPRSLYGNRITALRWAQMLRRLGHSVTIAQHYDGEPCDLLVALHASRSAEAALRFREMYPAKPLVVALTGTDIYRDLPGDARARRALEAADRLVALQPEARRAVPAGARSKVRVIFQSAPKTPGPRRSGGEFFEVCVAGHLRELKDPFRTAYAARALPPSS